MSDSPIGIFDSGIGGLTVVNEVTKAFPKEKIIYLGDTARVPYGTRGNNVINQYAIQLTRFLLQKNVKLLIVACNTMSAISLSHIKKISKVPVADVITPTVKEALKISRDRRIGVIGTSATITSRVYEKQIKKLDKNAKVFQKACPLFVPLVEEGFSDHLATEVIAKEYLEPLKKENIDTLILGCTHYPFLKKIIQKIMGERVLLVDSAQTTAQALRTSMKSVGKNKANPPLEIYFTDLKKRDHVETFLSTSSFVIKKAVL
jgi:glutamate racemase